MRRSDSLVRLIVGKLGSGKTWYCVRKMIDALLAGDVVVSNVELDWPAVQAFVGAKTVIPRGNYRYIDSAEIDENPARILALLPETGSMCVIDEIHLFLGARNYRENEAKSRTFFDFLTMARKKNVDMYLITQDERNADAVLVRQATHIVRVVNWLHLPMLGSVLPLPVTIAKICAPDGRTKVGTEWIWRGRKVGNLYNTRQSFKDCNLTGEAAKAVIGGKARDLGWGGKLVIAGVACLLADAAWKWKHPEKEPLAADAPADPELVPVVPSVQPAAVPVPALASVLLPCSPEEVREIESALPPVYKVRWDHLHLVGGSIIRARHWFCAGQVLRWEVRPNYVKLFLDSKELPSVNLYYANSSSPARYNLKRGGVGNPGGVPARGVRPVVPSDTGSTERHALTVPPLPVFVDSPQEAAGASRAPVVPAWTAVPAFIPR